MWIARLGLHGLVLAWTKPTGHSGQGRPPGQGIQAMRPEYGVSTEREHAQPTAERCGAGASIKEWDSERRSETCPGAKIYGLWAAGCGLRVAGPGPRGGRRRPQATDRGGR